MNLTQDNIEVIVQQLLKLSTEYAPRVLGAIATLIIGLLIIRFISKIVEKALDKPKMDDTLKPFFITLVKTALKVVLVISAMGILGIEMTSFAAIIGALGLAFGMALSGTLQNFAGGVIVLIMKPFKKGDYISAAGYEGFVEEIQIFNTIIKTVDNKVVIIPNGQISNSSMTNFTHEPKRRVDFVFGVSYGTDFDFAKKTLLEVINADNNIDKDPEPFIVLGELGDSSVNITVRVWTDTELYWDVYFSMIENVYKTFTDKNIGIPFPQMDVHMVKE